MDTLPPHDQNDNAPSITLPLLRGQVTLINEEDADLAQIKWRLDAGGYVVQCTCQDNRLNRIVLERKLGRPIQQGMIAEHRNGNPLDNRRENLREATQQQNTWNMGKRKHKQYKGIKYSPRDKAWIARINDEHLGSFKTADEAAFAYDKAALERFGEFARLNHSLEEVLAWQPPVRRISLRNTSGFRGIRRANQPGEKWVALIMYQRVTHCVGTYDTPEEAARAYDRKAIELKGDKALTNFPRSDYEEEHE